jgi:hypothetical protein
VRFADSVTAPFLPYTNGVAEPALAGARFRNACFWWEMHFFHSNSIGIQENVVSLDEKMIEAMIRSIPNPPMDREDVDRFRRNLEKHLRGDFSAEERHRIDERKARTEANVKRIISNCGGKNPLLGY